MTKDLQPPLPAQGEALTLPRTVPSSTNTSSSAAHSPSAVDTLKQAMRRARHDNAERASVVSDLRTVRLGRLELLHEALKPLVAQIPADVDTFDIGLVPTANPRLFIDMIGFIEMGRDARQYRLLQDTRTGRVSLAESEDVEMMVEAVTDYVARRLLERDKALAADTPPAAGSIPRPVPVPAGSRSAAGPGARAEPARVDGSRIGGSRLEPSRPAPAAPAPLRRRGFAQVCTIAFSFLIDLLGSIALFSALALMAWYAWNRLHVAI